MQPAIAQGSRRFFRHFVVPFHDVRAAHNKFTDFAGSQHFCKRFYFIGQRNPFFLSLRRFTNDGLLQQRQALLRPGKERSEQIEPDYRFDVAIKQNIPNFFRRINRIDRDDGRSEPQRPVQADDKLRQIAKQ